MNYPPGFDVAHRDGSIVVDANIYPDHPVARKLHNRVVGHDRERESGLIILDSDERQGNLAIRKPGVIESQRPTDATRLESPFSG